jgi:hypothetical protein
MAAAGGSATLAIGAVAVVGSGASDAAAASSRLIFALIATIPTMTSTSAAPE